MNYTQMSFLDQVQKTLTASNNFSITENGAIGFKTTGKKLLDLNFAVSSLRNKTDAQVEQMFADACGEGVELAMVWLFFARDVRGGLGERRLFRIGMKYLSRNHPQLVRKVLPLISEYGRWDDVVFLMDTKVRSDAVTLIRTQLVEDMKNLKNGKPVSLLGKWLPSENTSSPETRKHANELIKELNISARSYRLMLSKLRKKIKIIETQMSQNEWSGIDYKAVPSRANLIYNKAFLRHDEERRREFLAKLERGETKINATTLFPHDILQKCKSYGYDAAIEAMWKALPNTVGENGSTIVVADGSGSMMQTIKGTNVSALTVANALAIYFAERLSGPYKDRYITFSENPQLVNLGGATTLYDKNQIARRHNEVANTNIEAVFDLLLETAVKNHLTQADIPANVLVISDMEFDSCVIGNNIKQTGYHRSYERASSRLFDEIARRWSKAGYKLPRLVFWNVMSRTGTIPVVENDMGVALVSGFSPNVAKMVMGNMKDPMDALLEMLASDRYQPVVQALVA